MRNTHSGKLERYLGTERVEHLSRQMRNWYGPPIALDVPGNVWARKGGDFEGPIATGVASTALCFAEDWLKRFPKRFPRAFKRWQQKQITMANIGFSSLGDLISEATTGGKRRDYTFIKVGTTGAANAASSLFRVGTTPASGNTAAAAPGGTAFDKSSAGALYNFDNPGGTDTQHFVSSNIVTNQGSNTLLLYDRLFGVTKTMSSTVTEAVTGVPTRYTNTVAGSQDSAEGNFLFPEIFVAPSNTHNWTVCLYTNQAGTAAQTVPSIVGISGGAVNRLDLPLFQFFATLATGDTGIKVLTQMQCSASITGTVDFVIGHPLVWHTLPITGIACITDGISTAFNLVRIFNDACLAYLECPKTTATATTYQGTITTVRG